MVKIKFYVFLVLTVSASWARSEIFESWGAEATALYLHQQEGNGQSTTLLPMANGTFYSAGAWRWMAQAGATAYKDANTDKVIAIGVARINPHYQIAGTSFSVEGLIGLQSWDGYGINLDTGLRGNYSLGSDFKDYVSDIFLQAGSIAQEKRTDYVGIGISTWFK